MWGTGQRQTNHLAIAGLKLCSPAGTLNVGSSKSIKCLNSNKIMIVDAC